MKTTILLLVTLFNLQFSYGNPSQYEEVMKKNIDILYGAETNQDYQNVVNTFDRIAEKEPEKWEPLYYAAFGSIMMATMVDEGGKKDRYLDQALERVKKALTLAPQESELFALEGFVHMMRITVDPASRGQQYIGLSMQSYDKALALNAENPRALYLMGEMEYGTARFFKSDTSEACAKIKSAVEKFETHQPENSLAPAWGKNGAVAAAERCEK